eukprot:3511868-Rhodomonas_salina.5
MQTRAKFSAPHVTNLNTDSLVPAAAISYCSPGLEAKTAHPWEQLQHETYFQIDDIFSNISSFHPEISPGPIILHCSDLPVMMIPRTRPAITNR